MGADLLLFVMCSQASRTGASGCLHEPLHKSRTCGFRNGVGGGGVGATRGSLVAVQVMARR